ncbi:MAG: hypothetical protein QF893_23820 [Alphaproteobacteria bacterium]|jgi:hypothetical protein|nr:hypothetical protein [Alphaproteobacteria bacterium]
MRRGAPGKPASAARPRDALDCRSQRRYLKEGSLAEFVVVAIALALASATPGPGVFALVARALASGSWATLPMALGMMLGDLVYLLLAAYGLSAAARRRLNRSAGVVLVGAAGAVIAS